MNGGYSFTPAQREAIATLDRSVYLPAGAGSGKTAVLVERFLGIVSHENPALRARVDQILALTFTEKAAVEMKRRIRHELRARGLERDLRAMETSYIGTIHGFCARLLRENAFAANVDPDFEVLDEVSGPMLLERVLADCLEESGDEVQRLVLRYGERCVAGALRQLLRLFKTRGFSREEVEQHARHMDSLHDHMRREMERELLRFQEMASGHLAPLEPMALEGAAEQPLARLAFAADQLRPGRLDVDRVCEIGSALGSLKRVAASAPEARAALTALREEFKRIAPYLGRDEAKEREGVTHGRVLLLATLDLMLRYDAAKSERRALDFDDLQQFARDLLRANRALRDRYRRHFRYMMVDEFQDTNPLQAQIVDLLRRPRDLFVVGDAKQSIYGFRDADVGIFREYERKLCDGDRGRRIPLRESFRSRPELIRFVNCFFAELWREDDFPFEPLEAAAVHGRKAEPSIEVILVQQSAGELLDQCRLTEAHLVAGRVRALVGEGAVVSTPAGKARPLGYGDVALLFRAGTSMHLYERVFRDHGIPHHVSSGRGFYQSQEVADLINLLSVVDNPINDIPLASVLRSPFVGVSEDTFYLVRHADEGEGTGAHTSFYEALLAARSNQDLAATERERLASFLILLGELRDKREELPLGDLVAVTVERTRYDSKLLTSPDARRHLANVQRFVELADTFQGREPFNLRAFLEYLRQIQVSEPREAEAPIEPAVRFLTIHGAKGLEFPVVVIADMGRRFRTARGGHIVVSKDYLVTPKYVDPLSGEAQDTASSHLAKRRVQEADFSEEKRLLYVAMTRAAEHLILVGSCQSEELKRIAHATAPIDWVRKVMHLTYDAHGVEEDHQGDGGAGRVVAFGGTEVLVRYQSGPRTDRAERRTERLIDRVHSWLAAGQEIPEGDGIAYTQSLLDEVNSMARRAESLPPASPSVTRYSVTELMAYGECPREYALRFVCGLQARPEDAGLEAVGRPEEGLAFGTTFHSVMGLLDLSREPSDQLAVLESAGAVPRAQQERLEAGIAGLWGSHLFPLLRSAPIALREQPFSLRLGGAVVAGTIDLLVRTAEGEWWVVDYKTDSIDGAMVEQRAQQHRFQAEAYAYACGRILDSPVSRVLIYFVQPQVWWEGAITAAGMQAVESELARLVRGIESACFTPRRGPRCRRCVYDRVFCQIG